MKESKEVVEKVRQFINTSECSPSIIVPGVFNVDTDDFLIALEHFLETGENVLDELYDIFAMGFDSSGGNISPFQQIIYQKCKREKYQKIIDNDGFWNIHAFLNESEIHTVQGIIDASLYFEERQESYPFRRRQACSFTSNPKTRERIFSRDGKICAKCGSKENLQLDHIIPVSIGGVDSDENLQVLCRFCNSSKGNQVEEG